MTSANQDCVGERVNCSYSYFICILCSTETHTHTGKLKDKTWSDYSPPGQKQVLTGNPTAVITPVNQPYQQIVFSISVKKKNTKKKHYFWPTLDKHGIVHDTDHDTLRCNMLRPHISGGCVTSHETPAHLQILIETIIFMS